MGVVGSAIKAVGNFVVDAVGYIAETVSTAVNWVDQNIFFGGLSFIGRNTIGRVYQFGNWIVDKINPPKIVKDL